MRWSGYLSGRLLLFCELLGGVLSLPELLRPLRLLLKNGRQPELGSGSGGRSSRRSGLGVLFGPNTLSSWKVKFVISIFYFSCKSGPFPDQNLEKKSGLGPKS